MHNEAATSNFTTLMRIASPQQAAVSMSAALLAHWQIAGDEPVEIHLEGKQGIGKSSFVNGVCMNFWDEYVGGEDSAAITKLIFDYYNAEHTKNGIRVISIDEGKRRFGWSYYHEGSDPRSPVLEKRADGKSVLFVENPCETRRFIIDDRATHDVKTRPDIIVKFSYPVRQICQRLSGLDSSLREPVKNAAVDGAMEATHYGWNVEDNILTHLSSVIRKFSNTSEEATRQVRRAMSLRRVETSFDQSLFSADAPAVKAFIENEVPLPKAWNNFEGLRNQALGKLPPVQIYRREI